jgi:hypothetical protein
MIAKVCCYTEQAAVQQISQELLILKEKNQEGKHE